MTNAVTISLWFNVFGALGGPACILDKAWKQPVYHDWTYRAWSFWYPTTGNGGTIDFMGNPIGGPPLDAGVHPVNNSQWYHVVCIADGGNGLWQIYTNGVLGRASIVTPFTLSTGPFPLVIGAPVAQTDGAQTGFYGAINDVRIYNRALSVSEVRQLYVYESAPPIADSDGDGVADDQDLCPNTPQGSIVDTQGCSIDQLVPCDGPATGGRWKNHGQYVSTVVKTALEFLAAGLMTEAQAEAIVCHAARSTCGK